MSAFDYYYGIEAEQFSFYRVPRALIKDNRFKGVSSDAKLLYGLMLDRMAMSMRNGWLDEQNRVYIIYTLENIMEDLNCSKGTGVKILAELDTVKGIGLIERKKRGQGKPAIIFVKNFIACVEDKESGDGDPESVSGASTENGLKSAFPVDEDAISGRAGRDGGIPEVQKLEVLKSEKWKSGGNEPQEVQNLDFWKSDSWNSRSSKFGLQEVQKPDTNYNNNNYTEINYINPIYQSENNSEKTGKDVIQDDPEVYMQSIRENIDYDNFATFTEYGDRELAEELYQIICDVVCVKRNNIKVGGEIYPYELVKSRFLKLKYSHLKYVMGQMKSNTNRIKNIRSYLITTLYNAPETINHFYQQEVQHDMYGYG